MKVKQILTETTDTIFAHLGITPEYEVVEAEDSYLLNINGRDLNFLIGYRGDGLDGLQQILNLVVFRKTQEWAQVSVDINGYRQQRKEKLEKVARDFIDRVRFFTKEVRLPPMNSYERKVVHEYVAEYDDIVSESEGEGPGRHVVLKLK